MGRLHLSNLTMVKDGRQQWEKEGYAPFYYTLLEKSLTPSEKRLTAILSPQKPKSILGFEPGLLGQNAVTLLLAPPPRVLFQ